MKTMFKSIMLGGLLFASLTAHAQSGTQGGGSFTEVQMKDYMGELSRYFADPQSRVLFPEVDTYEKVSGTKFTTLIQSIEPKVVYHKVYGPFNEERDCVSRIEGSMRYFECDQSRIPEARLENQPLLYSILLHEVMVHAGIEKPTAETVPSKYPVSSRIGNTQNLSLVTYQKWVPKVTPSYLDRSLADSGITCSTGTDFNSEEKVSYSFVWKPNGDYILIRRFLPAGQKNFGLRGMAQSPEDHPVQDFIYKGAQTVARALGGQIVTTVLARGNSSSILETASHSGMSQKYRNITHDVKGEKFIAQTITEIEKTPEYTRGSDTEFPLYVHFWKIDGLKKREQFRTLPMICTGDAMRATYRLAPIEEMFKHPEQHVFKQDFIESN
jgi:hypothetical protein